jgi:hypothetical protein
VCDSNHQVNRLLWHIFPHVGHQSLPAIFSFKMTLGGTQRKQAQSDSLWSLLFLFQADHLEMLPGIAMVMAGVLQARSLS